MSVARVHDGGVLGERRFDLEFYLQDAGHVWELREREPFSALDCVIRLWVWLDSRKDPWGRFPGNMTPRTLERKAVWKGKPGLFWEALVECGFIDEYEPGVLAWHDYKAFNAKAITSYWNGKADKSGKPTKPTVSPSRYRLPESQRVSQRGSETCSEGSSQTHSETQCGDAGDDRGRAECGQNVEKRTPESVVSGVTPESQAKRNHVNGSQSSSETCSETRSQGTRVPSPQSFRGSGDPPDREDLPTSNEGRAAWGRNGDPPEAAARGSGDPVRTISQLATAFASCRPNRKDPGPGPNGEDRWLRHGAYYLKRVDAHDRPLASKLKLSIPRLEYPMAVLLRCDEARAERAVKSVWKQRSEWRRNPPEALMRTAIAQHLNEYLGELSDKSVRAKAGRR